MRKTIKNFFKKEIITTQVIEFQPIKREIDKNVMFASEAVAREFFNLIYNEFVQEMLNYNWERAKMCQDILRDVKVLSDIHWSKINFNITTWQIVARNTQQ